MQILGQSNDIVEIAGALPVEFCNHLITKFGASNSGVVTRNYRKACRELLLTRNPDYQAEDSTIFEHLRAGLKCYQGLYNIEGNWSDSGYELCEYLPGGECETHIDGVKDLSLNSPAPRIATAIFYLNTSDGGETYFPRQHQTVRPEAGKLVIFPPHFTHPHRSLPVKSGSKFIAMAWILGNHCNYTGA